MKNMILNNIMILLMNRMRTDCQIDHIQKIITTTKNRKEKHTLTKMPAYCSNWNNGVQFVQVKKKNKNISVPLLITRNS